MYVFDFFIICRKLTKEIVNSSQPVFQHLRMVHITVLFLELVDWGFKLQVRLNADSQMDKQLKTN